MQPRQDLVSRGYCLAEPGEAYVVYLETPVAVDVKLDVGRYRITWIDAGRATQPTDGGTTSSGQGLTPPPGGDDWLVKVTREHQ